jgi:hypothetical protein
VIIGEMGSGAINFYKKEKALGIALTFSCTIMYNLIYACLIIKIIKL